MSQMTGPAPLVSWTERPPGTGEPLEQQGLNSVLGGIPLRGCYSKVARNNEFELWSSTDLCLPGFWHFLEWNSGILVP